MTAIYRANNIILPNVINEFRNTIERDMVNVGWVQVSSGVLVTNASNSAQSIMWDVLQSPGNTNQIGNNWYLALGSDLPTNCNLWITMFAGWNTTTNQASQYCPAQTAQTNGATGTLNVYANGFASVLNVLNVSLVCALNMQQMPNVSNVPLLGMNYWYNVSIDRVICATMNTWQINGNSFYAGTYDSFQPLSIDTYPLVCCYAANANPNPGAPQPNTAGILGFTINEYPAMAKGGLNSNVGNFNGMMCTNWSFVIASNDAYNNRGGVSRIMLHGRWTGNVFQGGMRGLFKDLYVVGQQAHFLGDILYFQTPANIAMNLVSIGNSSVTLGMAIQGGYGVGGSIAPFMQIP